MNEKSRFRFIAYKTLKENLGKLDAFIEVNEIAVRELISQATASGNPNQYISTLSEKHGIRVNTLNFSEFPTHIAHLYILSVYQQAEEFFENYRDEHPQSKTWKYDKDDVLIDRILKNIGNSFTQSKATVGKHRLAVFEYYRMVRNRFMHTEVKDQKLKSSLDRVLDFSSELLEEYRLTSVPNPYHQISFDDFILFSRVVKDIAFELCQIGKPSNSEIAEMIVELYKKGESTINLPSLKNLKNLKNNHNRLNNVMSALVGKSYNLQKSESQPIVDILIDKILNGQLA